MLGAVFRLESQAGYSHSKAKKSADTKEHLETGTEKLIVPWP